MTVFLMMKEQEKQSFCKSSNLKTMSNVDLIKILLTEISANDDKIDIDFEIIMYFTT